MASDYPAWAGSPPLNALAGEERRLFFAFLTDRHGFFIFRLRCVAQQAFEGTDFKGGAFLATGYNGDGAKGHGKFPVVMLGAWLPSMRLRPPRNPAPARGAPLIC